MTPNMLRSLFVPLCLTALAAAIPAQRSRIVVVLDRSGSMAKLERMPWAIFAVEGMVASASAGSQLALLAFDDDVQDLTRGLVEIPPGVEGHRLRRDLMQTTRRVEPRGSTDILGAMERAIALGADEIVLATDGVQTQAYGGQPAAKLDVAQVVREQLSRGAAGVRVFAIGIGDQADPKILRAFATASDGAFFQVRDAAGLFDTFTEIGRLISGAFVSEGDSLSIFPGDHQLKLFLHAPTAPAQTPWLAGAGGDIALDESPALFAAAIGPLRVFNFTQSPPPGAYRVHCGGVDGVRILTEKRAPYRFVLASIPEARANTPLQIVARIERLEPGAALPGADEVRFELHFDQGERDPGAKLAGPFAMERTSESTFAWRGFLLGDRNPEGAFNARLIGDVSGWKAGDAAAFQVLPAVAAATISTPGLDPVLPACTPGAPVAITFHIERQHWPAELAILAGVAPGTTIAPGTDSWTWSFVAPTRAGQHEVELPFTAPGAVLNGEDGGFTFRTRVRVVDPVVAVRFPEGRAFQAVPGVLPLEIAVPEGSSPVRLRLLPPAGSGASRMVPHDARGALLEGSVELPVGVTRFALRVTAPLACPAGPFADTLCFVVETPQVRLQIDGEEKTEVTLTGTIAPIDASTRLTDAAGETVLAIEAQVRSAGERLSLPFTLHLDPGSGDAPPELTADLRVEADGPALELRIVERTAAGVRFALEAASGLTPGVHRGTLRLHHASPRVRLRPDSWTIELHVPRPTLVVSVLRDGAPVQGPIDVWAPALAEFGLAPMAAPLTGLSLILTPRDTAAHAVLAGPVRQRSVDGGTQRVAGEPGTRPGAPHEFVLEDLMFDAPGEWLIEVPLTAGDAASIDAGPLGYEDGYVLLSVRLRRVPARELAAGLLAMLALLYVWYRARHPGVRMTLELLAAPEGGYLALPSGLLRVEHSALLRGGRFFRRRSVRIGAGARVAPGRGDSGGARLLLRRQRADHWLHRRGGSGERVFVRRGGARLLDARVLLRDGDVLVLGAYEVRLKMASTPVRPASMRPFTVPTRPPVRPPVRPSRPTSRAPSRTR